MRSAKISQPLRLLQDETQTYDSKALSRWFASRPNARQEARNVAAEIEGSIPSGQASNLPLKTAFGCFLRESSGKNRAPAYRSSD